MVDSDKQWISELSMTFRETKPAYIPDNLGEIYKTEVNHKGDPILYIKPSFNRLKEVVINFDQGKIDRVSVEGNKFYADMRFLKSISKEYRRTFNTYDPIDDEQFFFYPINNQYSFVAIDSWVPLEEQQKDLNDITFKSINFYFDHDKIPMHYRDGWLMVKFEGNDIFKRTKKWFKGLFGKK